MVLRAGGSVAAASMHDEVTGSSQPRGGGSVVRVFKVVAALITAPVAFAVIVVAVVTVVLWLTLGATLLALRRGSRDC
jgi:type IV secretory pathway VirB2 component (pilin)